ncbi:cobaltochelatase subunit CobN [Mesorhizobium sp. M4B.F.Ca.ET.215.01.1.1]|uniref:cobaltochelatase subunit CobN n=9 Tax=Mesorhizobium TaxID=68287 RepID=UPI001092E0C7|nr:MULTISPECIES: cobaltochelatase subunit CobN [unclassified Mesorhizobium]TGQ11154.1 cobaltochelatase subunit CobN [Mesorhizobium sp. M4B.F.Ca.ET.215.01.1.1]TGQ38987.1 cobaltochelatase subunit CobN [Mesorhizobium sp. M4B.F.Ca.ET.214.01.1.1]TGQ44839.1 cobaltochelatase subunit CobN [Mesorhizobium sp. M00.F.Ca.ET.220.01.1.1]TGQ60085.1 cobaltochelatase subunit CobN [Mesorhizobium sp. M4B.F.Ca.ET.211.01.1.1]TGR04793.1 cobaltochelatase subunit CobN [Mesorhizobium sp. M4B.F.Ca.ET.203.01.1.1]
MHILTTTSASLDDLAEPVDLRQTPADVVALSFTDSDLSGLAAAWKADAERLPSMRLAALRDLRHPMSVDLWIDSVARHANVILVRILGGYDWWRYGCDQLAAVARERGIKLALLPGESHDEDLRLIEASTLPRAELDGLLGYFREGGPANMTALVKRLARLAGSDEAVAEPVCVPKAGYYEPGLGVVEKPVLSSVGAPSPPSLSCRTSPPQGGRSAVTDPGAPSSRASKEPSATSAIGESVDDSSISPLEGEMSGRTERGATKLDADNLSTAVIPILFYRSMLLAADVAPIDALVEALRSQGIAPVPIFVSSLKDQASLAFVENALASLNPAAIITATAFASGAEPGAETLFDRAGVPVFQVIVATTRREVWEKNQRGLAPADLAMHVVLPELDGRILAGAISFKGESETDPALAFRAFANRPEAGRIAQVAKRIAAFIRLRRTERAERKLAILIPDYPSAPGRTGYAVGLDVPSSVLAMLHDLKEEGYAVDGIPQSPRELLDALEVGGQGLSVEAYFAFSAELPRPAHDAIEAAWGKAEGKGSREAPPSVLPDISPTWGEIGSSSAGFPPAKSEIGEIDGASLISPLVGEMSGRTEGGATEREPSRLAHETHFPFRAATFGNVTVALAPDRGRSVDRRADYHDPTLPPRHDLIAFGLWLQKSLGVHALIHVGAHGTLEWLPGKTVALSDICFPEIVTGALPVIYPFIVSNPGEAAQAKRRIAAVTLGHLPPPLTGAGLDENQQRLERLVDEYAQADGLDRRRRDRLARLIVETARKTGLASEAGVARTDAPDEALRRIDAWLCDLKDFAVKDGLHVYGRAPEGEADPLRRQSAKAEKAALLAALDGRHIKAGPAGAPARGRSDVLPTGRNLFTADPRTMPTPTAYDLGQAAAEEVVRSYMQLHGDWPRSLVIDLWGSASLRTGGEEIAQGLALMGCRPQWDAATGRVTGIEVLPPAALGRPRVDVTWRISGLFRDMFPTQIALIDAAATAVASRDEDDSENPLAAASRAEGKIGPRIFGTSPGTYGAGVEDLLSSGDWVGREEIGRAYLDATSHAYGGADGEATSAPGAFEGRIAEADLLVHTGDDPGRDILEGSADVAFIGGFSAALAALGKNADVIVLDTTDPQKPRPRSVGEAVARVVRARAVNPRFIAGQMRHGPRGASEFAETVDRLVGFAETTHAISGALIEAVHDAYLGDAHVRAFILRENPAAAKVIAERFLSARRRGLWHPLRNSIDDDLAALIAEAQQVAA